MSETFRVNLKQGQTGKYERNGQTCDAEVVYVSPKADGTNTFALIKKDNCKWDTDSNGNPVKESGSICRAVTSGDKYLLGLPVDSKVIKLLKANYK